MKSRLALLGIAAVSIFILACPLVIPPGVGVSRTAGDGGEQAPPSDGTISVVNDEARGQAVYINENGVRFDVVAEEYPGGPLVKCILVADFTLVPQSTETDALPVKVIVAGTREDGSPGIWEIRSDDSIDLPQPEQTEDNTARAIISSDMPSLPATIQTRFGWTFNLLAVSADGKIIVGYAEHKSGATIDGVWVPKRTTIGVYWRVYSLPYTRFCIVSAPRIIGTFTKQPLPAGWDPSRHPLSENLRQLKLLLVGKLESYLTMATAVRAHVPASIPPGYDVTGINEEGLPSVATIDKNGGVTIDWTIPDVAVSVSASPEPVFTDDSWKPSAVLTNSGNASATQVQVDYWLSSSSTLDTGTAVHIAGVTVPTVAVGVPVTESSVGPQTLTDHGFDATETYYLFVTATAAASNFEINLDNNTAYDDLIVEKRSTTATPPDLSLGAPAAITAVPAGETWSFTVTVANAPGAGQAAASSLGVSYANTSAPYNTGSLPSHNVNILDGGAHQNITVTGSFGIPGTYQVELTADEGSAVTESDETNNTSTVVVPVIPRPPVLSLSAPAAITAVSRGETWAISVTVTNAPGAGTAAAGTISLNASATNAASSETESYGPVVLGEDLVGGFSKAISFSGSFTDSGMHHVTVTVNGMSTPTVDVPVLYSEVDFDTFNPFDPMGTIASNTTTIEVFGAAGDTGGVAGWALWDADSVAIISDAAFAWDIGNSPLRPINATNPPLNGYAYVQTGGLQPGVTYYVRVRFADGTAEGGYAVRMLAGWAGYSASDLLVSIPSNETIVDSPDTGGEGLPTHWTPLTLSSPTGRYLTMGHVNWFKVVLP